ncbi:MAG: 16S rRNA (guanine(966)-N(2))-methyltransferase RsmD [Atopobiaceae bacterium]|jgi:16S rRNA (guanine966-N2)-methyltransferase|nr:16S rRNA (guanine(966)-N(2))-methyltransferase RsmD [Atopobiaceae bacterium]MCI2173311.1 16S rRNA (guanine(966)-N(2))-methyltransferase RsmD [Atopobiaceae bacterium]MCI2207306.1 16S rRNA (guanine(966)-N(2))-methyltransferase RsmD [Atopobiaceae bacterium]
MRIVSGQWRGRPIEAPDGRDVTRPTTDRVREAIVSMVVSARDLDLSCTRALDAFAGSGALGLEMLSRDAAHVTFVDRDREAVARVRRNAASLGADTSRLDVRQGDIDRLVRSSRIPGAPFDLILLDPPYARPASEVSELVVGLVESRLAAGDSLVCYERSATSPSLELEGAILLRQRRYGQTAVDLVRLGG